MIKNVILIILDSLLLISCTGVKSFDGKLLGIGESYFVVDCSDEVNNGKKNVKDFGYLCIVQKIDETKLRNG